MNSENSESLEQNYRGWLNTANGATYILLILFLLVMAMDFGGGGDMVGLSIAFIPYVAPIILFPAVLGLYYRIKLYKTFSELRTAEEKFMLVFHSVLVLSLCLPTGYLINWVASKY